MTLYPGIDPYGDFDPANSPFYQMALAARKKYAVPGSRNADAPMRAAAAAGEYPHVDPERPQPGLYKVRLVPRGPFVPVRFFWTVGCELQGAYVNPHEWWLQASKNAISREEYEQLEEWCHEF